jgi:hypothetical protein
MCGPRKNSTLASISPVFKKRNLDLDDSNLDPFFPSLANVFGTARRRMQKQSKSAVVLRIFFCIIIASFY